MPYSQSSDLADIAAKLVEVDTQLAEAEADLMAQLQSIQDKRKSIKTVIDMFAPSDTGKLVEAPTTALDANGKLEESFPELITPKLNAQQPALNLSVDTNSAVEEATQEITQSLDDSQLSPTPTADTNGNREFSAQEEIPELDQFQAASNLDTTLAAQATRKQKNAPTRANRGRTAKTPKATNSTKKTQGWQDYLQEEFSDVPLSVAVSAVLQQQQDQALEITSVVDAIFVQEMPSEVQNKARDRVNNILSEGVRKNKWYRADSGSYSMSAVANSDDLAS